MPVARFYYLVRIQFLGFRYSGWQKQPNQKTIEQMILKTLKFVLPHRKCKILGAGRTDAKVSALDAAFELFIQDEPISDTQLFLQEFNKNLPPDIRGLSISQTTEDFNIIQSSKLKEYVYLFSFGEKNHPFCAPFFANILQNLDIESMKKAARLFEGTHDFSVYTARIQKNTKSLRKIKSCEIKENTILTANFFPEKTYALHIQSEGFMRYQVRMIMGALIKVGSGELTLEQISASLVKNSSIIVTYVAPGSGLLLNQLEFN
jgi:tRNA pseudouridine38-40 synthase